jgi:hypothetical protein
MRPTTRHLLLMFAWLTVGYAVVHVVAVLWVGTVAQSVWQSGRLYETIQLTKDGEPLIQVYAYGRQVPTYRRLDGTLVPAAEAQRTTIGAASISPTATGRPRSWRERLEAFKDDQIPGTYWYAVEPPEAPGTMFFVGYDELTRGNIGYVGRDGFSATLPAPGQSFPVRLSSMRPFHGVIESVQYNYYSSAAEPTWQGSTAQYANAPPDALWVMSPNAVFEVRLTSRTVRQIFRSQEELLRLASSTFHRDEKLHIQLLVRTGTELLIINPATGESESLPIGAPPPQAYQSMAQLEDGRRVVHTQRLPTVYGSQRLQHEFTWYAADGSIEKQAEVATKQYSDPPLAVLAAGLSAGGPAPIGPVAAIAAAPWVLRMEGNPDSFGGRLNLAFRIFGAWLVIALAIGVACAWACRRREVDVFGNASWLWPILVGALGWFGWMAYICIRPLPARLPHGHWMPPQPEPNRPVGTEVFA